MHQVLIVIAASLFAQDAAAQGKVTLPARDWLRMVDELSEDPERPPVPVLPIERRIDGALRKGLFSGTLVARFQVIEPNGHVRVPILDGGAALGEIRLNGAATSLLREGGMYTVGVDKPGVYTLSAKFFWGKEQDRFARRLAFRLPEAGPTSVSVLVPEPDIEARLTGGALTLQSRRGDATLLSGQLDPTGQLNLSWNRKLSHRGREEARMEAKLYTLFTIQESLVEGRGVFDLSVLEGETDRIDLTLPADLEVVRVEGDAVLQWHTETKGDNRLVVLLRYLVDESTRISVFFQFPSDPAAPVRLRMPLVPDGTPYTGLIGVQAPAGLKVDTGELKDAEAIEPHDLPPELTELSDSPLLFGFSFTAPPAVSLKVARQEGVELTTTLIDELQASTVLLEDGWEVSKLKLRMRNNVRQYLKVRLPPAAVLTHSLIDGHPVRPAAPEGEVLLLPLRQSEKTRGELTHLVVDGETLSGIANFYYSDPSAWQSILQDNAMGSEWDLQVGQSLRIPARANVQESSFVIELAYKRKHAALGMFGFAGVSLPQLDVDTVEAVWHVYLPDPLDPLVFRSNLTQYSALRYDPFRRVRDFLRDALWMRDAWAGGKYENILSKRKMIYAAEARRSEGEMVLASFPLVGTRYRFRSILLGQEAPRVGFTYATFAVGTVIRWLALMVAAVGAYGLLHRRRDRRTLKLAAGVLVVMLVVAYFVLGVHRRILWGVDLALLVALARGRGRAWLETALGALKEPWGFFEAMTLRNLGLAALLLVALWIVLAFPLLLSSMLLAALFLAWRRQVVRHA